jgi:hypothetical protein
MSNDPGSPGHGGGKLKQDKTERMINDLLNNARTDYRIRQEAIRNLEELDRLLNDPLLVNNKETAADICTMLIKMLVGEGVMKEHSIMHRLGLRLLDYIGRAHDEDPELALALIEAGVNLERTGRGLPAINFSDRSG